MNTQPIVSASRAAILTALLGIVPLGAFADQHAATTTVSRVADVPLSDLNLSTPEGMRQARERLRAAVESVCAEPAKSRGLPRQPNFAACVDSTLAAHLELIDDLGRHNVPVSNSETHAVNVSLADLDLATPEGARVARERLAAMARRLCGELARQQDLYYQPDYATCVRNSLAGGLAQVDALAAARNTRTARLSEP